MGLPLLTRVEKTAHEVETHWISGKENVPDAVFSKESNTVSILGHERTYYNWKRCDCK